MNFAHCSSFAALLALFLLVVPKFASGQSYQLYQTCNNGNVTITTVGITVSTTNTLCWYTVGPGNSGFWVPNSLPTTGSGGIPLPPIIPLQHPNSDATCFEHSNRVDCSYTAASQCREFGKTDAISAVMPNNPGRVYTLQVQLQGGFRSWTISWDDSENEFQAFLSHDGCSGIDP
jgi:hypothetical protein